MSQLVEISSSAEEQIEFHKIRELLAGYARGAFGHEACLKLHPMSDITDIQYRLDQVYEYSEISALSERPQLSAYEDVAESLEHLAIDEIGRQMEQVKLIHQYFSKPDTRRDYPEIFQWTLLAADPANLIKPIRAILDEKGEVRPNASPELLAISRSIETEASRLNREFVRLIARYKSDGYLTDTVESVRSGRRVLCVQAEYKRKIKGIIHDESTTGRTVFLEPELIVEINNNIIELEGEFKKEVLRLLKELCQTLRPQKDHIDDVTRLIHHWDLIQSISLLSMSYRGQRPKLQDTATLHLIQARHPLLYLKNKTRQKVVIPFDLILNPPNRLLILSGPNAGGKSILMKATGLIQVMAQCGMLIPADGSTVIGVVRRICVDIGDQQSIEEDLSTYSSRLRNMKETLDAADDSTMILVDEFGSGTDPKIGGAIAEAILDALVRRNTYGVLTTHYPNIKMYAHNTKGVVNGAMMFDKEKIQPTYQLKIGKPGSSFAFEIAERTGLPADVIEYARKKVGTKALELEDLIHDLDDKTLRLSTEIRNLQDKQKDLDRLVANYEQLRLDLEIKRKKFKIDQKKASLNEVSQYSQEMNRLLKDLKNEKNAEKAKEQIEKIKVKQSQFSSEIKELAEELVEVTDFKRGFLTKDIGDYSRFENELDIRGMLPEEASHYLERFIDAAFMSSQYQIRIVHGKGTGVLRQLVARKMKSYPFKEVTHPEKNQGGDGVTIGIL